MDDINGGIQNDIVVVGQISVVPLILEIICKTTGMGFAAVARVTRERWIACDVRDEIKFGLIPGGELKVDTTICHEIRQSGNAVIIDNVDEDEFYATHHTPAMYGFKSYISMPIARQDGSFFGTLCAIDPTPALLNTPEIIGMFKEYAALVSFLLNAVEQQPAAKLKLLQDHAFAALQAQLVTITEALPDKRSKQFADKIQQSSGNIQELIHDLKELSKTS